jgi:hypothetical protein
MDEGKSRGNTADPASGGRQRQAAIIARQQLAARLLREA